ncbi:MAG: LON peptidase substrate-binding domain-containing protein [Candidatus Latescibacterota bacterium]|jgi:ATP-dependent Lon protease
MTHPVLPLFPLPLVLFPGQRLPLHIFEPRYRAMIADCRAAVTAAGTPAPFGVILGRDTHLLGRIGCAAVIEQILREHDDGCLDLVARGDGRFRVLAVHEDKSYLTGSVEPVPDEAEAVDPVLVTRVGSLYGRLAALVAEEVGVAPEGAPPARAFELGQAAGLTVDLRQHLLEIPSENRRLEFLRLHLEGLLPALEERAEERRRVRSNGRPRA